MRVGGDKTALFEDHPMTLTRRTLAASLAAGPLLTRSARADTTTVRIAVQPGMTYLVTNVMQHRQLLEKHAAAAGLAGVKAEYVRLAAGNNVNDAVISGAVEIGATGVPAFLLMWAKTRGSADVMAIAPFNNMPLVLVTRNPAVQKVEDLGPNDRIALPGVGVSSQAIMLRMAAARAFGDANFQKYDALTINRGHPDAMAALLSNTEINCHFTAAPYLQRELAVPGIHPILTSTDVYGGPGTIGVTFSTKKFRDANPKLISAFLAAVREAMGIIKTDHKAAADAYMAVSGDNAGRAEVETILADPITLFDSVPRGTMKVAEFMHRTGQIKILPEGWKTLFVPELHDVAGS
jgi:NitT/TauT family transport system substrate-binding protein